MNAKFAGKSSDEIHAMVNVERAQASGNPAAVKRAKAAIAKVRAEERKAAKVGK